jgi:hypothetical protein
MGKQRGGGGVADAHFAETDHIAAGRGQPEHDAGALLDGLAHWATVIAGCSM